MIRRYSAALLIVIIVAVPSLTTQLHAYTAYLDINVAHKIPIFTNKALEITSTKSKGGLNFHVYFTRMHDKDNEYLLDDYGKWSLAREATQLAIRVKNGKSEEEVKLPRHIMKSLLDLFRETPTKTSCGSIFDCACFVHHAHGLSLDTIIERSDKPEKFQLTEKAHDYWQISEFAKQDLTPGDVIRLYDDKINEQHFALYLAPNLFISKFGAGSIYASDLTAMKQVYPYPNIETWKPADLASCAKKMFGGVSTKHLVGACLVTTCALIWIFSSGQ